MPKSHPKFNPNQTATAYYPQNIPSNFPYTSHPQTYSKVKYQPTQTKQLLHFYTYSWIFLISVFLMFMLVLT